MPMRVPVVLASKRGHDCFTRNSFELARQIHSGIWFVLRLCALDWVALSRSVEVSDHRTQDADTSALDAELGVGGCCLAELAPADMLNYGRLVGQVGVGYLHDWSLGGVPASSFCVHHLHAEMVNLPPELFVLVEAVLIDYFDALLDLRKLSERILGDCLLIRLLAGAVAPDLDVDRQVLVLAVGRLDAAGQTLLPAVDVELIAGKRMIGCRLSVLLASLCLLKSGK